MQKRLQKVTSLIGFIALCLAISGIGGAVTRLSVHDWYQDLDKPPFTPPDWAFAPVWIALYFSMGISAWLVWWRAEDHNRRIAMTAFGGQLALNLAWSFIFFGAQSIGWAAIELVVLWSAVVVTIYLFWKIDRLAGGLLVPYFIWTSYAFALNVSIYVLN